MKKIGFLGAYEKTNLIIYIAKLLTLMNKRVLVVDATNTQRSKYIIPNINDTELYYINNYQDIDIAIGFRSFEDIAENLGTNNLNYDIVLLDIENMAAFESFELSNADKNFFVTTLEAYSIKRGLEIIKGIRENINIINVIFAQNFGKEQNQYLDYLTEGYNVNWEEYRVCFPLENGDQSAMIENEMASRIRFRNLSSQFQEGLSYIVKEIVGQEEGKNVSRIIKEYNKGK